MLHNNRAGEDKHDVMDQALPSIAVTVACERIAWHEGHERPRLIKGIAAF